MVYMKKNIFYLFMSFLLICPYAFGDGLSSPLEPESMENTYYISSDQECIAFSQINLPLSETHYLSSEAETHIITLSYGEDTAYIISVMKNQEDSDCKSEQNAPDQLMIAGYRAEQKHTTLDGVALEEFLYGWTGKKFADRVKVNNDVLELFSYSLQSKEHEIVFITCGPIDTDLEAKALRYALSLKIESY